METQYFENNEHLYFYNLASNPAMEVKWKIKEERKGARKTV